MYLMEDWLNLLHTFIVLFHGHVCFFVRPSGPQISEALERIFTDSAAS